MDKSHCRPHSSLEQWSFYFVKGWLVTRMLKLNIIVFNVSQKGLADHVLGQRNSEHVYTVS